MTSIHKTIVDLLSGKLGLCLGVLILLCYVACALEPFDWNPPRRVENNAVRAKGGTIEFRGPGVARTSSAPEWIGRAIEHEQFTIRLRVRTASIRQTGPARMFTLSADPNVRNVMVGQEASDLVIRLRTLNTTKNGLPSIVIRDVFNTSDWCEIDLMVRPGVVSIELDGHGVFLDDLPQKALSNWDHGFRIGLGNELNGSRPWLGEISRATVIVDDVEYDLLLAGAVEIPANYWDGLKLRLLSPLADFTSDDHSRDAILNFLCFIPLGFVLAVRRRSRGFCLTAVTIVALTSLAVETAQLCFDSRFPSILDWGLNVSGAACGVAVARGLSRQVLLSR